MKNGRGQCQKVLSVLQSLMTRGWCVRGTVEDLWWSSFRRHSYRWPLSAVETSSVTMMPGQHCSHSLMRKVLNGSIVYSHKKNRYPPKGFLLHTWILFYENWINAIDISLYQKNQLWKTFISIKDLNFNCIILQRWEGLPTIKTVGMMFQQSQILSLSPV